MKFYTFQNMFSLSFKKKTKTQASGHSYTSVKEKVNILHV